MKIRTKMIVYIVGFLLVGVVSAILTVTKITLPYIESEEIKSIQNDVDKASLVLESDIQVLERTQRDWTWWDDTYNFVKGEDNSYIDVNLGKATLEHLNLIGMLYYDKNENSIYSGYLNEDYENIVQNIIGHKGTLKKLFASVDENCIKSGITIINQKLFMVSAAGISTTDGTAPANGYLIMIKELDDEYIAYLEKLLGANIQYYKGTGSDSNVFDHIALLNIVRNGRTVQYVASANDILNENSIIFESNENRLMLENAVKTLKTVSIALVIVFLIISIITIIAVEKREVNRILYLTKFVQDVIFKNDMSLRMAVPGKDEIASLGNNINYMLEELNKNYITIKKNEEHLHLIMEAINDGYFDYDVTKGTIDINKAWLHYLGYHDAGHATISIEKALNGIVNNDYEDFRKAVNQYLHNGTDIFYKEVRVYKAERGYIWILVRGRRIECGNDGKATRFVGSLSDITKSKENEQRNIYLLQTDPVTNLKNRTFLENKIKEFDDKMVKEFCVIMADVNGLKLMNDAFGHKEGDRLLSTVGEIIKISCMDTDICGRWGGDEFLILTKSNRQYADRLMNKIRSELDLIDSFPIKISIAMGCSPHKDTDSKAEQVIFRAEEKMYRNKLLEARSFHSGVIASFEQTLYEKKIETPEKISRRRKMCQNLGKLMELSSETVDELVLLNQLQDIGKISMPDYIIMEKDGTDEDEWNLQKRHVESGYRIAKAIPEIAHIAGCILYHHENFDGSGYPTGIVADRIPIISRIIAVVNYYDLRMNGENRESVEFEVVKQEIERKSGSQFDPEIVSMFIKIISTLESQSVM